MSQNSISFTKNLFPKKIAIIDSFENKNYSALLTIAQNIYSKWLTSREKNTFQSLKYFYFRHIQYMKERHQIIFPKESSKG